MNREAKIDQILARIDQEAADGWCSNWAEVDETPTRLIVILADNTVQRYTIPRV